MKAPKHPLTHPGFYAVTGLSLLLGLAGGLATMAFIAALKWVQQIVWQTLPAQLGIAEYANWYVIAACTLGGILLGIAIKYLGQYPESIEQALEHFKKSKRFDYQHIPNAVVISLISLGFGAALGPEAALTAIMGGIGTWIALRIRTTAENTLALNYVSVAAVLGALFGTPVGSAALPLEEEPPKARISKPWLAIPGLVAALSAWWVFSLGSGGTSYFHFNFLPYTFRPSDLAWCLLPAIVGALFGLGFIYAGRLSQKFAKKFDSHIIKAAAGGLGLGILAVIVPLALFSGHEGIQTIIDDYAVTGGLALLIAAAAKAFAANLCLATGWKGGQFFPTMFVGAAAGLGLTHFVTAVPPMVGLVAGLSAALSVLLKKPLVAAIFTMFFFPPALYAVVVIAAVLSAQATKRLKFAV